MKQFKARASIMGLLMINDRSGKQMGDTVKTYLQLWVKEQIYGRRKEVKSKYLAKGNACELEAIGSAGVYYDLPFLKNTDSFEDEYFTGTCDIGNIPDWIFDTKCSWDFDTFPLLDAVIPEKKYEDQMQVYMHGYKRSNAGVIFCLMDMPVEMLEKEAYYLAKSRGDDEWTMEHYEEVKQRYSYEDIPDKHRFRRFDFKYIEDRIAQYRDRIDQCREYINTLMPTLGYIVDYDSTLNTFIYTPL